MSLRVACVQMNTRGDVAANVRGAVALVEAAAADGARLVALPETWAYKGGREGIHASAEAVDGPSNAALAQLAARLGIFVLAGSIYEPSPDPGRVYNTSALFGPDGGLRAVYRKIHLFDVTAGTTVYRESDDVMPGAELVTAEVDLGAATVQRPRSRWVSRSATTCASPSSTAASRSAARRSSAYRRPSRRTRARLTGKCCSAPAPSRTAASSSPRARWGSICRGVSASATA